MAANILRFPLVAFALTAGLGCARGPLTGPPKPPSGTFTFPSSKGEIEEGYEAYYETLAPYGSWLPDAAWGVRFCPTQTETGHFRPYVDGGHWSAERPAGAAPVLVGPGAGSTDSPYWVVDETAGASASWTDITTHHGWWVNYDAEQRFCWIPGTQATDARVVWRSGNGFVGWAPEPPAWVDDGGDSGLPWVFTFLGSLYFQGIGSDCITGESPEYERVAAVTREGQRPARDADAKATENRKSVISHRGPGRSDVGAAKSALAAFAATGPTLPAPRAPRSGSSTSTDDASDSKKKKLVVVVDDELRPSLILPYLLANPPQGRLLPNVFAPSSVALDPRSMGSGAVAVDEPRSSSTTTASTRSWEGPTSPSTTTSLSSSASGAAARASTAGSKSSTSSASSSSSSSRTRPASETSKASTTRPTVSVGR